MKLDYKRTIKVGFAFLIIMVFWEVYDFCMPLILTRTYGLKAWEYGLVMGLDNLLSMFLLPLFGMWSDKSKGKRMGKRTPFIIVGTVIAAFFIVLLGIVENIQFGKLMEKGYGDLNYLVEQGFLSIGGVNDPKAIEAAQIAFARSAMEVSPMSLAGFIVVLLFLLVAMSSFRSPGVALMSDITVKPLRSQGNAIINFMGGVGAVTSILLYTVLLSGDYPDYLPLFITLAVIMLFFLVIYLIVVRENKFVALMQADLVRWDIHEEEETLNAAARKTLSRSKIISLVLILGSIFFWFMGFNAVKSHLSVYGTSLGYSESQVGVINLVNSVGGAIGLLPVAIMATRLGRKKTIIIGLVLATVSFIPAIFVRELWVIGVLFVVAGFGLVIINVNTLPMVVELARGSDVGKYTGYYYMATMSAQAITPALSGVLIDALKETMPAAEQSNAYMIMFVYACVMFVLSLILIAFVKHGDNKPTKEEFKEAANS